MHFFTIPPHYKNSVKADKKEKYWQSAHRTLLIHHPEYPFSPPQNFKINNIYSKFF
jgi:hypothetical protein